MARNNTKTRKNKKQKRDRRRRCHFWYRYRKTQYGSGSKRKLLPGEWEMSSTPSPIQTPPESLPELSYYEEKERVVDKLSPSTKHVLVLCQRKKVLKEYINGGENSEDYPGEVDVTVRRIYEFIYSKYPENTPISVEFLTTGCGDESYFEADYKFALALSEEAFSFIVNHFDYYDMIFMNTCPIPDIDFEVLAEILKPDGKLYIQAISGMNSNFDDFGTDWHNNWLHEKNEKLFGYFQYDKIPFPSYMVKKTKMKTTQKRARNSRRTRK